MSKTTWEYEFIECNNEYNLKTDLNRLGKEGWELVSMTALNEVWQHGFCESYKCVLKREVKGE